MKHNETRFLDLQTCLLRAHDGGQPKIVGYAAVFNELSPEGAVAPGLFGFRERIRPGSFTRTLKERSSIVALLQHKPEKVLGNTRPGTLRLNEDDRGLHTEIHVPNSPLGQEVTESVRRGDIDGMSIRMEVRSDDFHLEDGVTVRELIDVELIEISLTAFPVYQGTSAALRSLMGDQVGLDYDGLERVLVRSYHKLPLQPEDVALLRSSIAFLGELLPADPAAEGAGVEILRRQLELKEKNRRTEKSA